MLRHEGETYALPDGLRLDVFVLQRIDHLAQMAFTTYHCDTIAEDGTLRREVIELQQRYYTRFELERWLSAFRLELHGDFDGSRLTAQSSSFVGIARR